MPLKPILYYIICLQLVLQKSVDVPKFIYYTFNKAYVHFVETSLIFDDRMQNFNFNGCLKSNLKQESPKQRGFLLNKI